MISVIYSHALIGRFARPLEVLQGVLRLRGRCNSRRHRSRTEGTCNGVGQLGVGILTRLRRGVRFRASVDAFVIVLVLDLVLVLVLVLVACGAQFTLVFKVCQDEGAFLVQTVQLGDSPLGVMTGRCLVQYLSVPGLGRGICKSIYLVAGGGHRGNVGR